MTQRVVNYTYGTGNPVLPDGSIDVRDGIDNLQSLDIFMNADDDTYNQRDGGIVKTLSGAVRSVGFSAGSGDFTTGFTVMLGERNTAWYDPVSMNWYSYAGFIPSGGYIVGSGTNPVGDANWKPRTDQTLRSDLASAIGTTLIGFEQTVLDATLRTFGKFVEQYGAVGNDDGLGGGVDDTAAFQAALDDGVIIRLAAGKRYRITSQLVIKNFGSTFVGHGFLYSGSQVTYYGSGAMFVAESTVSYVQITGGCHFDSVLSVATDAYRNGTIFLDQQAGNVSAKVIGCFIRNFEYIFYGNYNSFYNLIENSRVTDFRYCYYRFSSNNLNIKTTRFMRFNTFALLNGTDGPTNIRENSFEMFNGHICQFSGVEEGQVNFEENYVEIFDSLNTPTNFPQSADGNAGKYGGNTLFSGPIRNFVCRKNNLQIGGAFRFMATSSAMKHIESTGNQISLYATGNNIDRMYTAASCDNVYICDVRGPNHGGDGGYTRTYAQTAIPTPLSDSIYRHWDCLLGKMLRPNRLTALPMLNGWTSSDVDHGVCRCELTSDGYTALQGLINGEASTRSTIVFIPTNKRPFEYGTTRSYANFTVFSTWGGGSIVRLRYFYATGELRYEGTPTSLFNLPLDGILIPPRV